MVPLTAPVVTPCALLVVGSVRARVSAAATPDTQRGVFIARSFGLKDDADLAPDGFSEISYDTKSGKAGDKF